MTNAGLLPGIGGITGVTSVAGKTRAVTGTQIAADPALTGIYAPRYSERLARTYPRPSMAWPKRMGLGLPILVSTSDTSGVTTPKTWTALADNSGPIKWHGPSKVTTETTGIASSPGHGLTGPTIQFEWFTDSPFFYVSGQAGPIQLYVDGEAVFANPWGGWVNANVAILFGGGAESARKIHHFRLVGNNNVRVSGIVTSIKDSLWAPTFKTQPLVGWVGDSFSQGMPITNTEYSSIPWVTATLLGWRLHVSSDGNTGFGYSGGSGLYSYADRVQDFTGLELDAMVFYGGINDTDSTTLRAGATQTLSRARALFPFMPFWVIGPQSPTITYQNANAARWTALQAASATDPNTTWIDTRGWVTGTGKVSAPTGDGNADTITSSDGTHPMAGAGDVYLASRIASEIAKGY